MNRKRNDSLLIVILLLLLAIAVYFEVGVCIRAIHQKNESEQIAAQQSEAAQTEDKQEQSDESALAIETNPAEEVDYLFGEGEKWDLVDHLDSVVIDGRIESDDFPYGYNVGKIEDDVVGVALLITPDTEIISSGVLPAKTVLSMDYLLHPWVAEGSDGAVLNVYITGESVDDNYTYMVDSTEEHVKLDLGQYAGQEISISLSVTNEKGKIADCDWVVLRSCSLETDGL